MMARSSRPYPQVAVVSEAAEVRRYFPLRVGYVWTYAENVVMDSQTVLQRLVTLTMQHRQQNEYTAHWDFRSGQTQLPNVRYRVVDDGVQLAQLSGDTVYTPFAYLLKAPLVVDTTWRTVQGYVVRIARVDVTCTAPAGTFGACIETLQDAEPTPDSRMLTRQQFAPGIGLVWQQRQLFQYGALARIDTMELQKLPEPVQL